MPQRLINMRVDEDVIAQVDAYAKEHLNGNRSEAVRELLKRGLSKEAEGIIAEEISSAVERGLERVIKAESRGAKASLGSLILLSKFLPTLLDLTVCNAKYSLKGFNHETLNEEAIYEALLECDDVENLKAKDAFAFAWQAAGNIQSHGTRPTFSNATQHLKPHGISAIFESKSEKGAGFDVA